MIIGAISQVEIDQGLVRNAFGIIQHTSNIFYLREKRLLFFFNLKKTQICISAYSVILAATRMGGCHINVQVGRNPESQSAPKDSSVPGSYQQYYPRWCTHFHSQPFQRYQHGQPFHPGRRLLHLPSRRR